MTSAPAIVVSRLGGPEVLTLAEIELEEPGPGQVRIDIAAAGVNFIDVYRRNGTYQVNLPMVPGLEGSGTVAALGEGVTSVAVGDRVAWSDVPGSYAAAVIADADKLLAVPDAVDDETAAAAPLQGLTVQYLVTESYPVRAGDDLLVHAGAGGVGLLLTQVATALGARVITTVSTPAKAELSRAAGAAEVLVGYDDFAVKVKALTGGRGVQAVYDGVGKDTFDGSLDSLAVRGTLVLFGGASGPVPSFDPMRLNTGGSLKLTRPKLMDFTRTREELAARAAQLFGWIDDGKLSFRIGGRYPLADAARVHEDLTARRTTGKLLLLP